MEFTMLFQVLGTDELNAYLIKYHIELDPHLAALVGRSVTDLVVVKSRRNFLLMIIFFSLYSFRHSRKPWSKFINVDNRHLAVPEVNLFYDFFFVLYKSCTILYSLSGKIYESSLQIVLCFEKQKAPLKCLEIWFLLIFQKASFRSLLLESCFKCSKAFSRNVWTGISWQCSRGLIEVFEHKFSWQKQVKIAYVSKLSIP